MIRNLELKDYEEAKRLIYQIHEIHYNNRPDICVDGNPLPIKYFKNSINDENAINYVYEEDNHIVGLLMATKKNSNAIPIAKNRCIYFIEDIVIDNNYRRKNIGKKLFECLQKKAIEEQIDAIELNVWAFNESAINFYEALGMSLKNMKFEKLLNNNNVELKEQNIKITNKVE